MWSALILNICLGLASCGGGGSETAGSTANASAPAAVEAPAVSASSPVAAEATPAVIASSTPSMKALSLPDNVAVAEESTSGVVWASASTVAALRTFYVDSQMGSDTADGRAATAAANGAGPWKSLGRLAQAALAPGDRVVLACGSRWRETLRLRATGTAAQPIVVTLPSSGCTDRPTIDGSVQVAAAQWQKVQGGLFEVALEQAPLQLQDAAARWPEAHHPNRGHDSTRPSSPFLPMAGAGATVVVNGRTGSTTFVTGADLQLPAGATLTPGTGVRIRTNAWTIEERRITSTDGNTHTLDTNTFYPTTAGWGYYLTGQAWMLDSPGEWLWDATRQRLMAVWPGAGTAPNATLYATVLETGLDLQTSSHVLMEGLVVRRVGTGAKLQQTTAVQLNRLNIEDTVGQGVQLAGSANALLSNNTLMRTGLDAISGIADGAAAATAMRVQGNLVLDSGTVMQGETPMSLPVRSFAAINAGTNAVIENNILINTGYIGIRYLANAQVSRNVVYGACSVLDDCGAIYTWGERSNNSVLQKNLVLRVRGNLNGKPVGATTAAQGIYLDDLTGGVLVEDNLVIDADQGMQLHNASGNTVRRNRLFANRRAQLWLQASTTKYLLAGDVANNLIEDNQLAPTTASAAALRLETSFDSTADFARFIGNRYLDNLTNSLVVERTRSGTRVLNMATWQASTGVGSTSAVDAAGFSQRSQPYTFYNVAVGNLVPNGDLAYGTYGWTNYNATAPKGTATLETCNAAPCLRYTPGGSSGLVSSPNFSTVQGQWYRLSVDVRTESANQPVDLIVRRGGGGANGYELLSSVSLGFQGTGSWQRQAVLFQATKTVNAADAVTKDLGARVDFASLTTGKGITLARVELVKVTMDDNAIAISALANTAASRQPLACPWQTTAPARCSQVKRLSDHQPVAWPLQLDGFGSDMFYLTPLSLADADRDGIADSQDLCAATPAGLPVNAAGCPL